MSDEIRAPRRPVSPPRRVATSLVERRWFSFLAELVLIVAGILIALYIDGWVQEQRDRSTATAYLSMLREDLVLIEAQLQAYVDFETANVELGVTAYEAIAEQNLPADERELQRLLAGLGTRRTLNIVSATYTDLTSAGNLQLIEPKPLRDDIVRYFAELERTEVIVQNNNSSFVDQTYVRFLLDVGITPIVQTSTNSLVATSYDLVIEALGESDLPNDDILTRPPASRGWADIRRQVIFRMRVAALGVVFGGQLIEATRELRADIENEIAVRNRE